MSVSVILAAAGSSQRMSGRDKTVEKIGGKSVILYSLLAFSKISEVDEIIVCASENNIEKIKNIIKKSKIKTPIKTVLGADTRQNSVANAFSAVSESSEYVMIHDAARPMITPEKITALLKAVKEKGAAALAVPVKDTVKVVSPDGKIESTPDRSRLFAFQTPQAFCKKDYHFALETAKKEGKQYTDDCQLFEAVGKSVYAVEGDYKNIKITTTEDLLTVKSFLGVRKNV